MTRMRSLDPMPVGGNRVVFSHELVSAYNLLTLGGNRDTAQIVTGLETGYFSRAGTAAEGSLLTSDAKRTLTQAVQRVFPDWGASKASDVVALLDSNARVAGEQVGQRHLLNPHLSEHARAQPPEVHGHEHQHVMRPKATGAGVLRALGPVGNYVATALDAANYEVNKLAGEQYLAKLAGRDGIPRLSNEAIAEYGAIVAGARIEQGMTAGLGERIGISFGFSNFIEWGKKNAIDLDGMVKLNPTSKSREQIEAALISRAGLMSQSETPDVKLAHGPTVISRDGRGSGIV